MRTAKQCSRLCKCKALETNFRKDSPAWAFKCSCQPKCWPNWKCCVHNFWPWHGTAVIFHVYTVYFNVMFLSDVIWVMVTLKNYFVLSFHLQKSLISTGLAHFKGLVETSKSALSSSPVLPSLCCYGPDYIFLFS